MAYYLRAFCTSKELPPLSRVLEWGAMQGVTLDVEGLAAGLDSDQWRKAEIRYKSEKQPLAVDASTVSDSDGLLSEEIEEFVELLEDVEDSGEKRRVLTHLRDSRAVIAAQLPNDVDDDGFNAVGVFLGFFVAHCGAMIQADGEGFYEGERLILEVG